MKQKIISFLGNSLGLFLGLLFLYLEVGGIVHSVRKHSFGDTFISVTIPPWAWYRSVEMWWHDDLADVNWDERLSTDTKNCYYLFYFYNSEHVIKANEEIESFRNKIKNYPKDKIEHLKTFCKNYIEWYSYSEYVLFKWIRSLRSEIYTPFKRDEMLNNLVLKLKKYNIDEINAGLAKEDSLILSIEQKTNDVAKFIQSADDKEWINYMERFKDFRNTQVTSNKVVYKSIFNEEYK